MKGSIRMQDLIQESFDGESRAPELDPAKARQFALRLREMFPNLAQLEADEEEQAAARVLGGARWQQWKSSVLGALKVTIAEGERSRIAVGQALRGLLETPVEWNFAPAGAAVRGEGGSADPGFVQTENPQGHLQASVTVSDENAERMLIATLRGQAEGVAPPLLLACRLDDPTVEPVAIEGVEVGRDRLWQYRLPIGDGEYAIVFGPQ